MLSEFEDVVTAIRKFRNRETNFYQYRRVLETRASLLGDKLDCEGDWERVLDAWLESIEYCYHENDWYELGCSLGVFLEDVICNERTNLKLPEDDRVVRENLLRR